VPLLQDRLAHGGGSGKLRRRGQFTRVLGEGDAVLRDVVQLAAHRRAQDHAGAFGVERAVGVAVVGQRLVGDGDRPLLPFVHRRGDFGRDAVLFPVELIALHPAADLGIGLVRRGRVGVVIVGDAPAIGWRLGNAIALIDNVLPERRRAQRIGEDGAHADNGDRSVGAWIWHLVTPCKWRLGDWRLEIGDWRHTIATSNLQSH
jgi:hypothetical protein